MCRVGRSPAVIGTTAGTRALPARERWLAGFIMSDEPAELENMSPQATPPTERI
jgi:hypothetical protein